MVHNVQQANVTKRNERRTIRTGAKAVLGPRKEFLRINTFMFNGAHQRIDQNRFDPGSPPTSLIPPCCCKSSSSSGLDPSPSRLGSLTRLMLSSLSSTPFGYPRPLDNLFCRGLARPSRSRYDSTGGGDVLKRLREGMGAVKDWEAAPAVAGTASNGSCRAG